MKVIHNSIIPFPGFSYMNIFGILFTRKKTTVMKRSLLNHELIHTDQFKDVLYIFFWIIYCVEWLIKIPCSWFYKQPINQKITKVAYRSISFEQEAYYNQYDFNYLENRKKFNWIKYIFTMYDPSKQKPLTEKDDYIEVG